MRPRTVVKQVTQTVQGEVLMLSPEWKNGTIPLPQVLPSVNLPSFRTNLTDTELLHGFACLSVNFFLVFSLLVNISSFLLVLSVHLLLLISGLFTVFLDFSSVLVFLFLHILVSVH